MLTVEAAVGQLSAAGGRADLHEHSQFHVVAGAAAQAMLMCGDPSGLNVRRAQAVALRSCTNLACTNLVPGGEEAARLASRRCSGCKLVRYCSAACSKADWRAHKQACRQLAVAAAAGTAGVA
jgi:hypothetical protein